MNHPGSMSFAQQPHSQLAPSSTSSSSSQDHPFDPLLSLETSFYQSGFNSGLPHGELHGLIEGRELGRDKAWELWEEIGYDEGAGRFWSAVLQQNGKKEGRCVLCLLTEKQSVLIASMKQTGPELGCASFPRLAIPFLQRLELPHTRSPFRHLLRPSSRRSRATSSARRRHRHPHPPHLPPFEIPYRLCVPRRASSDGCGRS